MHCQPLAISRGGLCRDGSVQQRVHCFSPLIFNSNNRTIFIRGSRGSPFPKCKDNSWFLKLQQKSNRPLVEMACSGRNGISRPSNHEHYDRNELNIAHFSAITSSLDDDKDIWIFGFGSLVHTPGFEHDDVVKGYVRGWRRVWWQGSTDHRGTPEAPGRTVTLTRDPEAVTFGVAYKLAGSPEHQRETLRYLEWREKQYDHREYVDMYATPEDNEPILEGALCYIATENKESNPNFLGPAPIDEIAAQIARAEGPSGPNWEYLFKLADSLEHVRESDEELFYLKETVQVIMEVENCAE